MCDGLLTCAAQGTGVPGAATGGPSIEPHESRRVPHEQRKALAGLSISQSTSNKGRARRHLIDPLELVLRSLRLDRRVELLPLPLNSVDLGPQPVAPCPLLVADPHRELSAHLRRISATLLEAY